MMCLFCFEKESFCCLQEKRGSLAVINLQTTKITQIDVQDIANQCFSLRKTVAGAQTKIGVRT